jgi:hypothetical protein
MHLGPVGANSSSMHASLMCVPCVFVPCVLHVSVPCSVNTRVGNELGAGNAEAARLSVYTCVVIVALVQSLIAVACR